MDYGLCSILWSNLTLPIPNPATRRHLFMRMENFRRLFFSDAMQCNCGTKDTYYCKTTINTPTTSHHVAIAGYSLAGGTYNISSIGYL